MNNIVAFKPKDKETIEENKNIDKEYNFEDTIKKNKEKKEKLKKEKLKDNRKVLRDYRIK